MTPEHVKKAKSYAEELGASFRWERGSSKITGFIEMNGKCRKLFMSVTPSDHRAILNIKKNIRDYVRELSQ